MKKRVTIVLIMMFIAGALSAGIMGVGFEAKEFDSSSYSFIIPKGFEAVDLSEKSSYFGNYAFKDSKKEIEVRYLLFSENGEVGDHNLEVAIFMSTMIFNLVGSENILNSNRFPDSMISSSFNGDFGAVTTATGDKTDYTKGYKYATVCYFCKKGLGIMCQVILFNDEAMVKTQLFDDTFKSFKFN